MDFYSLIQTIDTFIWGPPLIILLVGTGIFLTCRLRLIQVFKLPLAMKLILTAKIKVQEISAVSRHYVLPCRQLSVQVISSVLLRL